MKKNYISINEGMKKNEPVQCFWMDDASCSQTLAANDVNFCRTLQEGVGLRCAGLVVGLYQWNQGWLSF